MPVLTAGDISVGISAYDAQYPQPNADTVVRTIICALDNLPPSFNRFLSSVHVIADWGPFPYFLFNERIHMASAITIHWLALHALSTFSEQVLLDYPTVMIGAVETIDETGILHPPGVTDNQLAFLSKFLHWQVNSAFPLWDSFARKALTDRGYTVNPDTDITSYSSWTILIRSLVIEHHSTLSALRKPEDSLTRTLDKALWKLGKLGIVELAEL